MFEIYLFLFFVFVFNDFLYSKGESPVYFLNKDDLDEDGKPIRKPIPEEAFIDIAIDHGLASPDTADKTYRKALGKMKKELKKKDIL